MSNPRIMIHLLTIMILFLRFSIFNFELEDDVKKHGDFLKDLPKGSLVLFLILVGFIGLSNSLSVCG